MKTLIAEDDSVSRTLLNAVLKEFGGCTSVANGKDAYEAFLKAHEKQEPFDLICLDIMMPEMDGTQVLTKIRQYEEERNLVGNDGARIIMTTALGDAPTIRNSFAKGCEAYVRKPIERAVLLGRLRELQLI